MSDTHMPGVGRVEAPSEGVGVGRFGPRPDDPYRECPTYLRQGACACSTGTLAPCDRPPDGVMSLSCTMSNDPTRFYDEGHKLCLGGRCACWCHRCRYCGLPLEPPATSDPRSQECPTCLAEAHGGPENPAWVS